MTKEEILQQTVNTNQDLKPMSDYISWFINLVLTGGLSFIYKLFSNLKTEIKSERETNITQKLEIKELEKDIIELENKTNTNYTELKEDFKEHKQDVRTNQSKMLEVLNGLTNKLDSWMQKTDTETSFIKRIVEKHEDKLFNNK